MFNFDTNMVRHMFTLRGLDGFDHFLIGLKKQSHLDFIFFM